MSNGLWLSGSGSFSINNTTLDYVGNGLSSTSTLITLSNVTNSNITLSSVTYGNSRTNSVNYNYTILGSTTGLSWINIYDNGPLVGSAFERNDLSGNIQWPTNVPPTSPAISSVYVTSMSVTWGNVGSLSGYSLEASTTNFVGGTTLSTVTANGNAAALSLLQDN